MLLYGDEVWRTQQGNNNAYCQDNALTWFCWDDVARNSDIGEFCKKVVSFRKSYPILRARRFLSGQDKDGDNIPDISWFGKHLDKPLWSSPRLRTLCYLLAGNEAPSAPGHYYLFVVFNMHHRGTLVELPRIEGLNWYRLIDTSRKATEDFRIDSKEKRLRQQAKHYFNARSVSVFLGER